jgi:hypothetical protein
MSKEENRKYLSGLWAPSLIVLTPFAVMLCWSVVGFGSGPLDFGPALAGLGAVVLVSAYVFWHARRKANAMVVALRSPTPEPLLTLIDVAFESAQIADKDAFHAQSRAVALALYGDGSRAREALRPVDWRRRAPIIQAAGVASEGLIAMLCDGEFERGLRDAKRARSLAELAPGTFGSKASNRFYASLVAFGQVLVGEHDASAVPTLQEAAKTKAFPTLKAIALAGLVADAQRSGTAAHAEALRNELTAFAPALDTILFAEPS